MLIYVRLSENLKARVDELISHGNYSDFNAVVTVALENLLLAEQEATATPRSPLPKRRASSPAAPVLVEQEATTPEPPRIPAKVSFKHHAPASPPCPKPPPVPAKILADLPHDLFLPGQRVPVERWVFGQQNRVLPAKVNARFFVALVAERQGEVELFEAATEISKRAAAVYTFLTEIDQRFGHGKDEMLSTGFTEPDSEKAITRYANHFAAYESTQGNLTGMLIQWKFAGVRRVKNKTMLLPTQPCLDFANMPNPLLDSQPAQKPLEKLSADETAWAIRHIAQSVPVEASAFTTILTGMRTGANTPDALDAYVRENAKEKTDVSPAFISTQRSGTVSRMADLNLVKRQRDGTKVTYEITDLGAQWLDTQAQSTQQP